MLCKVLRDKPLVYDILMPEVVNGIVKEGEVDVVVGRRRLRRRYVKGMKGFTAERRTKQALEAIHDLADQPGEDKGENIQKVQHARAEVARIRAKMPTEA